MLFLDRLAGFGGDADFLVAFHLVTGARRLRGLGVHQQYVADVDGVVLLRDATTGLHRRFWLVVAFDHVDAFDGDFTDLGLHYL